MPAMGESVSEGTILEWAKQPGDSVEADETIVEISTDKVDAEVPSPASGTLTEVLAEAGETVTVGQVIARMTAGEGAAQAKPKAPEPTSAPQPQDGTPPAPNGGKVSPVARRAAEALGVDLGAIQGSGPAGRITKADVLDAGNGAASAAPVADDGATLLKGAAAMLARYMDESRSIPTATSFRTLTVTALDGRRKQLKEAGQRVSFTHLIAYAIARAATEQMPVMARTFREIDGKPHVVDSGQVNLGIAVDVERKDGGRTLMVPVIRDAGRLSFPQFLEAFNDLIARARENALTADDLQGANISLTNPGGIGTIASVPRLMSGQGTIVATGAIGYPPGLENVGSMMGAEKVMTMTSTYDHRIIQGAESGQFLQTVEAYLQGEHGFYEQLFKELGATLGAPPQAPAPAAAAAAAREAAPAEVSEPPDETMLQAVQAATSLLKAHRMHGHLAAKLDPLGAEPEGDPALDPEPLGLTPEIMARIPARILRTHVPGATLADALPHLRETYCGTIAYEIEHIASHRQRTWLREKIESGVLPLAADQRRGAGAAGPADPGRLARALHAQGLPGPEAVLDRGPGHDGPDARRDDPALGRQRRPRGGHRHGPPRPAQRARPQPRARVRDDLPRVRGRVLDRGRDHDPAGRHGRRQVPPRRPGHLPALRRRLDHRAAGVQPQPPRVRLAGGRGRHARDPDHPPGPARAPRRQRGRPDHPARRRRLPRPGRGGGDLQPPGARRLHGRRLAAPDPEQPGRLHDRPGRRPLDALGVGPREGLRRPDHPRQRRRRRGLRLRRAARLRLPPGVRPRRADRADRLSPLRPQRGRRAGVHAARDGGHDQAEDGGARDLRRAARRARGRLPGGGRRDGPGDLGPAVQAPQGAQGRDLLLQRRAADGRLRAGPLGLAGGQDRGLGRAPAHAQRGPAEGARGLHHPPQADQAARAPARGGGTGRRDRLGAGRGARLRLSAHGGHAGAPDRPGRRARDVLPAPPRAARRQDRPARGADPQPARRARADGAAQLAAERDRLPRASSTATRWRRPRRSCCGRPSSATS